MSKNVRVSALAKELKNWFVKFLKALVVVALRCLQLVPVVILWLILECSGFISEDNALEWWSAFLIVHIILGVVISSIERWILTTKLREYPPYAKQRRYNDVEGSQSFILLVYSIHGITAVAGATISYFVIASFFNQSLESYIFLNNEGAIAAITLIIVVASAAVVAVYVELAKSVRQQIDTYEVEISTLNQVLIEIDDYAEQVWRHFDSVSRTMLEEWKQVPNSRPSLLSQGRINDLERPLNLMASLQEFSGRELQDIDDREFWKFDDQDDLQPSDRSSGVNDSYGRIEGLEHSRRRYRHSMNLDDSEKSLNEKRLEEPKEPDEKDQRRRARRLRYLGWHPPEQLVFSGVSGIIEVLNISNEWKRAVKPLMVAARRIEKNPRDLVPVGDRSRAFLKWLVESGLLHIDETVGGEGHSGTDEYLLEAAVDGTREVTASGFRTTLLNRLADERFEDEFKRLFFAANEAIDENSYNTWLHRFMNEPATPSDDYNTFLPAHEKSLVYVMRELAREETGDAGEFIDYAIRDFDRRVWNGHLNRTVSLEAKRVEGGLVATLNKLCAQLDLDPSVFIDDLEVFIHLRGLVWFDPERTDKTTMNKSENLNDRERMALYRYAAYSRFVYYAFWLVEGPARFKSFEGASSRENMGKLKGWIDDEKTITAVSDAATDTEFLLLMLADQRSALFNWLRAVRACTVRKLLLNYESNLDKQQRGPTRHFGIEVIPARHIRLTELQAQLKVGDQAQKPIRLRSVYDLVPRQSNSATKRIRGSANSDQRYVDTYRHLSFSKTWEGSVTIPAEAMQRVFAWLDNRRANLPVNLGDKTREYLEWLVRRVFQANAEQPGGRPDLPPTLGNDDAQLLVQALWLVSPTFKTKFQREPVPSIGDASEVEQYRAVLRQISTYCLSAGNADNMKNTFFGGADPATRERATTKYEEWLTKFRDRAVGGAEDN